MARDSSTDGEKRFARAFLDAHPDEVALLLERMPPGDVAGFLEQIPVAGAVEVTRRMALALAADALERVTEERATAVLTLLPVDIAAGLLRRMEEEHRSNMMARLPEESVATLSILLRYPEHTAGAYMDARVIALPQEMNVGEARNRVRRAARQALFYLYVVNREQQLAGVVNLRELMLADGKQLLSEVMRTNVARIPMGAGHAEILAHPAWRNVHAMPVVDERDVFLGVIRYSTLRALEDEYASSRQSSSPAALALSLGEMYWLGISTLLHQVEQTINQPHESSNGGKK